MATKFSDFTAQAATGTTFVVGYDGTTNTQYSQDNLTNFVLNGDLTANANVGLATYNLGFTNGQVGIGTSSPLYTLDTKGTVADNWLARVQNESGTGYGLQVKVDSNSSGKVTFATKNSVGYTMTVHNNGNVAIGKNNLTGPSARLQIKGSGTTNATTALLVEDSSGNDIIKALDDRTVRLGYNANQITTESSNGGKVRLNNISGDPLFSASIVSGSTGKINVYGGYYNTFEYAASKGLVFTNQAGFHVTQDTSSMLTCVSSTKGFLPPRMTTTQRDAINSGTFTTGLTLYNTTDNKLQFYNGSAWTDAAGGDNIYTANGTLTGNRTVTIPANGNITFSSTGGFSFYVGQIYMSPYGEVRTPSAGRFKINSFSTELVSNYLRLYANNYITGTLTGFVTVSGTTAITHSINARLGVIGKSTTSTTDYAFRVQDSAAADMFSLRDDGAFALGKGATSLTNTNVVIGQNAKDNNVSSANSVVIGKNAQLYNAASQHSAIAIGESANARLYGVAIGRYSTHYGTTATTVGYSAFSGPKGVAIGYNSGVAGGTTSDVMNIGYDAGSTGANSIVLNVSGSGASPATANAFGVYMTSNTTPDFRVIGNEGLIPPSITTTVRDAISSPNSGSTIYNTTDNKLQFYNGSAWTDASGGGDNIYTADGTLSGNRAVTLGNNTLSFTTAGNGSIKLDSPVSVSRNPSLGVSMYIQGQGATSSTRSLLLENSNGSYIMSVKDDGQMTIGSGATIQSTSNPQYSIVIGNQAKDIASAGNASESVSIGRLAAGNNSSVAIGGQAKGLGTQSVAVGAQAQAKATGVSLGYQAGGATAGSSAVSIGKFAQAKATGSIAIGANTGLTGANSIVLNATTGVTSTTTTDTFDVFMTSASAPDLKFRTGDNVSYWNPAGETAAFGFSTTSPTATVDINGTFRLRAASNVSGKVLTADANGNGTWQTASGGSAGQNLLAITSITGSGGSQVQHDVKVYSNTTSNNFAAINFNSDETARFAKIVFTPTGTVAKVIFRALGKDIGGNGDTWLGLHSSSSQTASPAYGWFLVNKDAESDEYEHVTAEWLLTGLTANQQITAYVMGIASLSGCTFYARELNTGAWNSTGDTTAFPATVEAYDVSVTITSNPSS